MNMKKFLTVFILGLVVFAVSCSDESSFKKAVGGNTYNVDGVTVTFSADGSTASGSISGDGTTVTYSFTFVSAESSTKATYSYTARDSSSGETYSSTVVFTVSGSTLTAS